MLILPVCVKLYNISETICSSIKIVTSVAVPYLDCIVLQNVFFSSSFSVAYKILKDDLCLWSTQL